MHTESFFPIDETLCKDCIFRVSRAFIPLDYESYGLDINDFDLEEGEPLEIEQHVCLITMQDMDYVVKECNKFSAGDEDSLLHNNIF
jgi:hypothetical protein